MRINHWRARSGTNCMIFSLLRRLNYSIGTNGTITFKSLNNKKNQLFSPNAILSHLLHFNFFPIPLIKDQFVLISQTSWNLVWAVITADMQLCWKIIRRLLPSVTSAETHIWRWSLMYNNSKLVLLFLAFKNILFFAQVSFGHTDIAVMHCIWIFKRFQTTSSFFLNTKQVLSGIAIGSFIKVFFVCLFVFFPPLEKW